MSIINILVGLILVLYGRSLYWAFVVIAGLLLGFELTSLLLSDQAAHVQLLVGLLGGVIGAMLGVLAQRVAFSMAGLLSGAYLALVVARTAQLHFDPIVLIVVGGILGAILAVMLMDWAIIALSSLVGAATIVDQLGLDASSATLLFAAITVMGIFLQGRRLRVREGV